MILHVPQTHIQSLLFPSHDILQIFFFVSFFMVYSILKHKTMP